MPTFFPIKQDHVANLKPKGRRSKRYGGLIAREGKDQRPDTLALPP